MAKFACTLLRRSTTAALLAAVATTCLGASAQDKKKREEAKPVPSYYGAQPATESLDLAMYQAHPRRRLSARQGDGFRRSAE